MILYFHSHSSTLTRTSKCVHFPFWHSHRFASTLLLFTISCHHYYCCCYPPIWVKGGTHEIIQMQKVCSSENLLGNYRKNTMVPLLYFCWKKKRQKRKTGNQNWSFDVMSEWRMELWKMNLWAEWTEKSRWAKYVLNKSKNQMKCMACSLHSAWKKEEKQMQNQFNIGNGIGIRYTRINAHIFLVCRTEHLQFSREIT